MNVNLLREFNQHEKVVIIEDKRTNLNAIIAIHRKGSKGHSFGATRIWKYTTFEDGLKDALTLSKIMSYKCALAGLSYGGAKGIIIPNGINKQYVLKAYVKEVNKLKGLFITGADVGVSYRDVVFMKEYSPYIVGIKVDPVKYTVLGLIISIQTALKIVYGSENINKRSFAIQGLGKIGSNLVDLLYKRGAKIFISDIDKNRTKDIHNYYPSTIVVSPSEIHKQMVDVFSPCALSNCINSHTVNELRCSIVLGGANCQLESEKDGNDLYSRSILYCPDYVVNAGGLISVVDEYEYDNENVKRITDRIENIKKTLNEIYKISKAHNLSTATVVNRIAQQRLNAIKK